MATGRRAYVVFIYCAVLVFGISPAGAGIIPYTEDFNDESTTTSGSAMPAEGGAENGQLTLDSGAFFETPQSVTSDWDVVNPGHSALTAGNEYVNTLSVTADEGGDGSDGGFSEASLQLTNLPTSPGSGFKVTYDFAIGTVNVPGTQSRAAFDLLAGSAGGGSEGYVVRYQTTGNAPGAVGEIFIGGGSAQATGGNDNDDSIAVATDKKYTMTIIGSFVDDGDSGVDLSLTAWLTDGATTISETRTDTDPLTGQFFGFRNEVFDRDVDSTASELEVNYDNLSITPEPTSFALLLIAGLALLRRRR
jgi:hypothetical protein